MSTTPDVLTAPDWFHAPSADFQPATFWFWHAIPSEPDITRQLEDMKATGIGTVMVQARLAMPIDDYLSPAYLSAFRFACTEAGRVGLRVTIYDEYNWMSGHGGGRTVSGADHLRERHLFWTRGIVGADGRLSLAISGIASPFYDFLGDVGKHWAYEGGVPSWDEWTIVVAAAVAAGSGSAGSGPISKAGSADAAGTENRLGDVGDVMDRARLSSSAADGCAITVEGLAAGTEVTVFVAARCRSSRMINYLMPEAAERFAAVVYAPLLEAAGGTAEGFFFDHPYAGFYGWDQHHGDLGNSLLWDDRLPGLLDDKKSLALQLLALTQNVGAETAGLRTRFFSAYQGRLHDAFFGTLSRWTATHGTGFSGHELLTHVGAWGLQDGLGGFDPRTMPGVDYFAIDATRTHTSVDAADYAPQLSARFGDSVARAHGRKRCTIEQYSTGRETGLPGLAGQWGLTLEKFRAQAIRHLLFGARQILLHATNASDGEDGDTRLLSPRFDFPPGFNFEPWWEDCPDVFRELSRLSAFLEDGEPLRPVALLYPLAAINAGTPSPDCGRHFGWWAEALARAGIGYDIIDESGLARLAASGEREGPDLAADPVAGEAGAWRDAALAGYRTLILPSADTFAASSSAGHVADFLRAGGTVLASGALPAPCATAGAGAESAGILAAGTPGFQHLPTAGQAEIDSAVTALPRPRPALRFDAGPAWNCMLRDGDSWKIALFNDADHPRQVSIAFDKSVGAVRRWDPRRGEVDALAIAASDGAFRLTLAAQEALCLSFHDAESWPLEQPAPYTATELPPAMTLAEGWRFRIRGETADGPIDVTQGWETQGFADFAGTGIYRRTVDLPALAEGLAWHLVLPGVRETAECFANGVSRGRHAAGEAVFALAGSGGPVSLEVHVRNTAANRYYPGTSFWNGAYEPSGLVAAPRLEARAI